MLFNNHVLIINSFTEGGTTVYEYTKHNGDFKALSKIGEVYYDKQEYVKAMAYYRTGAYNDNAHSQYRLGFMYSSGIGVSVDNTSAMEWYLRAHNNGHLDATNNIGTMYKLGVGVPKDDETALQWYLKAANKGDSGAQFNVGYCYEYGCGVQVDNQQAIEWYEKSANQGDEPAKDKVKLLNTKGYFTDDDQRRKSLG
jgi:TPR repeat protein